MSLRSVTIGETPWFVAKDVCDALEIVSKNGRSDAVASLDQDEKDMVVLNVPNRRGNPNVLIVNESGLYSLILQSRKALAELEYDERGSFKTNTPGGMQTVIIVNESGLYSLILQSRKTSAKRFKKWVTSEVLPSIRHTGGYV